MFEDDLKTWDEKGGTWTEMKTHFDRADAYRTKRMNAGGVRPGFNAANFFSRPVIYPGAVATYEETVRDTAEAPSVAGTDVSSLSQVTAMNAINDRMAAMTLQMQPMQAANALGTDRTRQTGLDGAPLPPYRAVER